MDKLSDDDALGAGSATATMVDTEPGTDRRERLIAALSRPTTWAAATTGVLLVIYLVTALPGAGGSGDAAKFQRIAWEGGVPHQPGYPLYSMLTYAFAHVFRLGNIAWRTNVFSGITMALGMGVVTLCFARIGARPWIAWIAAIATGLVRVFWSQATMAEVYGLQILLISLLLYALLRWQASREDRWLFTAMAMVAITLGNHLTILVLGPGVLAFVLLVDHTVFARLKVWLVGAALVVAGLSQYLWIVYQQSQPNRFIEIRFDTVGDFIASLRGDQFASVVLDAPLSEWLPQLGSFALNLAPLYLLAAVGAWRLGRSPINALLGLWFVLEVGFALVWQVQDISTLVLPLVLVLGAWGAVGGEYVAQRAAARVAWAPAAVVAGMLVLPAALFVQGIGALEYRGYGEQVEVVAERLDAVPDDALVKVSKNYTADMRAQALIRFDDRFTDRGWVPIGGPILPDAIREYLVDQVPLEVDRGEFVDPGREVYAVDGDDADALREVGLKIEEVDPAVYHVTAP